MDFVIDDPLQTRSAITATSAGFAHRREAVDAADPGTNEADDDPLGDTKARADDHWFTTCLPNG
jgi:hypothetical protein